MKTSKIKEVNEVKPYTNTHGTTLYHSLTMENGDKINIGKKKEQLVGWELTYEITGDGQQEFDKAKSVSPEFKGGFQQKTNDNLKGVKIGHAITNAVILYGSEGMPEGCSNMKEAVKTYSKLIYEISEELNGEL